jgi:hypothetical protein
MKIRVPGLAGAGHGVEDAQELVCASGQGDFLGLARSDEAGIEAVDDGL